MEQYNNPIQVLSSVEQMKIATSSHASQFGLKSEGNKEEEEHSLGLGRWKGNKMVAISPIERVGCKNWFPTVTLVAAMKECQKRHEGIVALGMKEKNPGCQYYFTRLNLLQRI